MKHNAKRVISILLCVLMCIGMLTGIVLPAAAETTEPAADAYAAIQATDNGDGTYTPGKAVFVYSGAPASGATTYKYGDGTTWGNGKTYKLVGGVTAFSKMNAAIHYIESQWNAHTGPYSTYTGPDTVVVAPGNYAGSSWQNNTTVKFNLPKDDEGNTIENPAYYELFTYTVLGPQAGKDPTPKTKDAIANGTLSNGRGFDTAKEAISTSTLWMPQNAQLIIDGWAFRGSHNFHGSSSLVSLVMHNVVYRYDTRYENGLYRYNSPNNNINIEFHNYTVEYTQIATASVQDDLAFNMEVTRLVFDNYYEYGGNLDFVSDVNIQAHMINFYPTTTAKIKPNFLGEGNTTAEFSMTNSVLSHNRTAHWIRIKLANTTAKDSAGETYTNRDYAANGKDSVRVEIKDNYFYNAGDWCGTDYAKATYDGVSDGDRATLIDVFSFQDKWSIPAGALDFVFEGNTVEYTADCLARHKSGSQNGFVMIRNNKDDLNDTTVQDFAFKNNTLIMPEGYNTMTDSFSFSECTQAIDRSSLLVLNENNEVMAAPGLYNDDKINDVYAGDDFQGGIVEMFTVKTAKDMAFNNEVTVFHGGKSGVNPATAKLVIVPYASESTHDVKDLFTFRGNKVEFVGVYDKDGKEITSAKPSELNGCTMVASYKGKTTICEVTYSIRVATESDMVFLDAANTATSYAFNGNTYTLTADNRVASFKDALTKNKLFWVMLPGTYKFAGGTTDRIYNTRTTILGPKMGVSPLDENNNPDFSNRAISGTAAPYTVDTTREAVIGGAVTTYGSQNRLMMDGVVLNNTFQFTPSVTAPESWGLCTGGAVLGHDLNNVVVNDVCNNNMIIGLGQNSKDTNSDHYMGKSLMTNKPKGYFNASNTAFCNVGGGLIVSAGIYDINLDHIYASGGTGELIRTRMPSGILMDMSPMECGLVIKNSKIENWGTSTGNWIYTNYVDATLEDWGLSAYCNGKNFPAGVHQIFENNTFTNIGKTAQYKRTYALRLGIPNAMDNAKLVFKNNIVHEDELVATYSFIDICGTGKDGGTHLAEGNVDISGNVFINFSEPIKLGQSAAVNLRTTFNIDKNYYGIITNGKEFVKQITAKTGVAKSDWYYVDREMTTKNTEVLLADNGYKSFSNEAFDGLNNATIIAETEGLTAETAFKAIEGAEVVGVYADAACTEEITGALTKPELSAYVLVKKTATSVAYPTKVTMTLPCAHASTELKDNKDATCVDPGYTGDTYCKDCNTKIKEGEEIPATGEHTEEIVEGKEATCTETGLTDGKKCSVCDKVLVEQTEIPMKSHTEVVDAAVAPTCTETGLTEGKHCSVCNKVLVAQTVVDALGHTESEMIVVTPATPVSEGVGKIECTVCHIVLDDNIVIPVLDPTGEAYLNGVVYETVEAALAVAKANETVILLMNAEVEFLALDPDVTLDLNGNKLTAGYVIGFNGSAIIDTKDNGKLIVDKDKIALDLNNDGYLPVYDQDGYIFVSVNLVNRTALLNQKQYAFSPVFETEAHMPLMQGYENSGVRIVIRLTWEEEGNYRAKQDFIYLDELVTRVIDSYDSTLPNYKRAFSATFSGNEAGEAKDVKVSAVIISDTGVEIASVTTEFTA